jgi:hypothetical protein
MTPAARAVSVASGSARKTIRRVPVATADLPPAGVPANAGAVQCRRDDAGQPLNSFFRYAWGDFAFADPKQIANA